MLNCSNTLNRIIIEASLSEPIVSLRRFSYGYMRRNILWCLPAEDEGPAMRDAEAIESGFASDHVESPQFEEAKAYLACVCQLASAGCPPQETLEALSEPYKLAFSRYGLCTVLCCVFVSPCEGVRCTAVLIEAFRNIKTGAFPSETI